ncbi:MAG: septal ring lytic transglycosylase RlpA family protein [Fluviibacter sp.]|jgi:rare lipoprotein A
MLVCTLFLGIAYATEGSSNAIETPEIDAPVKNKRETKSKSSQSLQQGTSIKRSRVTLVPPDDAPAVTIESKGLRGKASFYGAKFQGRKTATGEIFNNKLFTAASNLLPLGSLVIVKRPDTNLCVVVKVNDRMHPKHRARVIDVSHSAAKYLDMVRDGVVKVQIVPISANAVQGSTVDCAMGGELEEDCENCDSPLQFNN